MAYRILVVEDEKRLNALIRDYLVATGFEVDSGYDGITAIELFRTGAPDLVILDIMLPGLDGLAGAGFSLEQSCPAGVKWLCV